MAETVIEEMQFEIGQIDLLLANYAALFDRAQQTTPDLIETTAIASVLHSSFLDWNKLEPLVVPVPEIWAQVKAALNEFLDRLSYT